MRTFLYNSTSVITINTNPVEVQRDILKYAHIPNIPCSSQKTFTT